MPDIQKQIKDLGVQITADFLKKAGTLKLSPDEAALVARAAQRLAYVAIYLPGADQATHITLAIQRDAALATLANLSVTKAIQAEQIMRQSVFDAVARSLKIGMGLALSVLAA